MMTSPEKCQLLATPHPTTNKYLTKATWKGLATTTGSLLGLLAAMLVGVAIMVGIGYCAYWYYGAISTLFDHINTNAPLTAADGDVVIGSFFVGVAVFFIAVHLAED